MEEAGRPEITSQMQTADGRITSLAFSQNDPVGRRGLVWTQRMEIALGYDAEIRRMPITLNGARVEVTAARGLPVPRFVLPTGSGIAYGGFAIDPITRETLLHHLPDIADALTRGSATVTLWEDMLDGRTDSAAIVEMLVAALPRERDELNLQRMLDYTVEGYWKFLRSDAREALAPRLEQVLRTGLGSATTTSVKSAWFSALRDVAHTPATLDWLERVWRETEERARARAGGARLHTARAAACGARRRGIGGDPRPSVWTDRESRPQGTVRLRAAIPLRRSIRTRRVLQWPGQRREPATRAVGDRGALLPAPPASRG